jgi:hypothetical protein
MKRRFFAITLCAAALAALAGVAAQPAEAAPFYATRLDVRFEPARLRYPRGTCITLAARLTSPVGALPGRWVYLSEYSTRGWVGLGWACTDGNGVARMPYVVPTSPHKDNVHIYADFYGDNLFYFSCGVSRIPIGL